MVLLVPLSARRKRYSSIEPTYVRADAVVYHHPIIGLIYPYTDELGNWWVIGGCTRIPASGRGEAFDLAGRWERTGKCPLPHRFRITPKSA